ncbi:hypothetical protein SLS62_007312 [Diatrype stigma]|uniref:Uncharacterized protein n=1 Tax=Diatrype stigma TaxID=117547 RepID=A0AAN9UR42_9PEZI
MFLHSLQRRQVVFPKHHHKDRLEYAKPPTDTKASRSPDAGSGTKGGYRGQHAGSSSSKGGHKSGASGHHTNAELKGKKPAWHGYFM